MESLVKNTQNDGIAEGIAVKEFGLTPKQVKFLRFLANFINQNGYSPSYEEMKQLLNYRSKSRIHSLIYALKKRGYVRLLPYSWRSIMITPKGSKIGITRVPGK